MGFSARYRTAALSTVSGITYDLCIIGGGITGAGIALDAASRGFRVLLLEKRDFASGTSSRSTKLIHGGLRYLKQMEFLLVGQVGRERALLHRLAPHLVVPEKMMLPLIRGGQFGRLTTSIGLRLYDLLAGVPKADRRKMYGRTSALELEPLLDPARVLGCGLYAEYRTDDARLTIEVIKAAHRQGAICLNYCEVESFHYDGSHLNGVIFRDTVSGTRHSVSSRATVNATGPWVDQLRQQDHTLTGKHLFLTKGVHVVVPWKKLPLRQSIYFDVPDGRMIFAIPREQVTYIGTTDTPYEGDLSGIDIDTEDIRYLLQAVSHMFPRTELWESDILSAWAGLRPLIYEPGKSASELSRRDEIFISKNGLISIAGGKLTGYRKMAEKVVNLIIKRLTIPYRPSATSELSLCKGQFTSEHDVSLFRKHIAALLTDKGLPVEKSGYLVHRYGGEAESMINSLSHSAQPIDLLLAELQYALEQEMVLFLPDFFIRRTGMYYFDPVAAGEAIEAVAEKCAGYLNWQEAYRQTAIAEMRHMLENRWRYC